MHHSLARYIAIGALIVHSLLFAAGPVHAQPGVAFPLESSRGGAFELKVSFGESREAFLLDTGAAMMTINEALYRQLRKQARAQGPAVAKKPKGEVAVRMADGRRRLLDVYELTGFAIEGCPLGPVDVVVVPSGRNLLGLNALKQFAPFTLSMEPPQLQISGCGSDALTGALTATH